MADEGIMEGGPAVTIVENDSAVPSEQQQHHLQFEEAAEESDAAADDDMDFFQLDRDDPVEREIHRLLVLNLFALRTGLDFATLVSRLQGEDEEEEQEEEEEASGAGGSAAAGLRKRVFGGHAAAADGCGVSVTECTICLVDFEDGEEVSGMPCQRGHEFHTECIAKWLGRRSTCPLCRHRLPKEQRVGDD